jgi:hypothetical protein
MMNEIDPRGPRNLLQAESMTSQGGLRVNLRLILNAACRTPLHDQRDGQQPDEQEADDDSRIPGSCH